MRGALLAAYTRVIGYRFTEHLKETLTIPTYYSKLEVERIRSKAGTSLGAAGVILGFSVAVLAAIIASPEYREALKKVFCAHWQARAIDSFAVLLTLYLVIRQERVLSRDGGKTFRYAVLICLLAICSFVLIAGLLNLQSGNVAFDLSVSRESLQPAFLLSGFLSIIASIFFQLFAMEFYDSASGWRGGEKEGGRTLRFHLAGIASHSFFFGISFAVMGVSLLLSLLDFATACFLTLAGLLALVFITEIERELWARKEPESDCPPSPPVNKPATQG